MSVNYVYALIDRPVRGVQRGRPGPSRSIRVAGHRIELVAVGPMWAAIEELERPPELSEDSLRSQQHDVAVALARRFDAILPARFGAALDTLALERFVNSRRRRIQRAFDAVRGRAQMTVRLFGPEVPAPGTARRPATGTLYLQSQRQAACVPLPAYGLAIRRAVRHLVERERVDAGRGRLRATLHHLIERSRAAEYRSLVRRAIEKQPFDDEGVVSGPWPPFAFAPVLSP
jgi:hypothetical protein